jgi:O-antigen/teichoic acid export membrane protein
MNRSALFQERLRYWTDISLGRIPPANEGQRRYQRIIHSTLAAAVARGVNLVVSFISVPLAVGYLGRDRYGVWITISSLLMFLSFADLGLGGSLQNALADAYGRQDRAQAKRYVASALWLLAIIALVLWIPFAAGHHWIAVRLFSGSEDLSALTEASTAILIAITIFFLNFPLNLYTQVLTAFQQRTIVNICAIVTSIGNLLAIIGVVAFKGGLVWLVLAYSGCGLLVSVVTSVWLYFYAKPWLKPSMSSVDSSLMRGLFGSGWKFLVTSIFWMVNLQTDNLIISHFLGPGEVTPYSISYRLLSYAVVFQSFAVVALWPAYTEAKARGDVAWIRRAFKANLIFSIVSSLPLAIVFVVFGQKIIHWWAGEAAVPQFSLLVWMAIWNLMLATVSAGSFLLNAFGRLTGMTIYGTLTAIVNIVLSIVLVQRWGVNGAVVASVLSVGLLSYIPIFLEARYTLQKLPSSSR